MLLIEKNRPAWQAGKLNGLGGKVEPTESDHEAMVREMEEEAGITIPDWTLFATLAGDGYIVNCFHAVNVQIANASTKTNEEIDVLTLPLDPNDPLIPNLRWLIPMALESIQGKECLNAEIRYHSRGHTGRVFTPIFFKREKILK